MCINSILYPYYVVTQYFHCWYFPSISRLVWTRALYGSLSWGKGKELYFCEVKMSEMSAFRESITWFPHFRTDKIFHFSRFSQVCLYSFQSQIPNILTDFEWKSAVLCILIWNACISSWNVYIPCTSSWNVRNSSEINFRALENYNMW